jgi:putative ABC transport system permease protein
MARRFWPGQNPIGRRFRTSTKFPWRTIVGIVGDVKYDGLGTAAIPEMYFSYRQALWPQHAMTVVLRTSGDPANLAAAARREVLAIDPDLPIYDVRTMEDLVYRSLAGPHFNMLLLEIFAGFALVLAAVGIYGVIRYSVSQRTHELGLRMAVGAQARDITGLVLREAMIVTSIGLAVGLVAALIGTRVLSTLLFGVGPTDPYVFVGVSALLTAVALLASYVPARSAARVDPINALRCE